MLNSRQTTNSQILHSTDQLVADMINLHAYSSDDPVNLTGKIDVGEWNSSELLF
jgi:hypothetical protein